MAIAIFPLWYFNPVFTYVRILSICYSIQNYTGSPIKVSNMNNIITVTSF